MIKKINLEKKEREKRLKAQRRLFDTKIEAEDAALEAEL